MNTTHSIVPADTEIVTRVATDHHVGSVGAIAVVPADKEKDEVYWELRRLP